MKSNLRLKIFILLCTLITLNSCARSRETLNPLYLSNRPVYKIGVIFFDDIPDSIKKRVLAISKINQIALIDEQTIRQKLRINDIKLDTLFLAEEINFYGDFDSCDFLIALKKEDDAVKVQFADFLKNRLTYFRWSKVEDEDRWFLKIGAGFLFVDAKMRDIEVAINYRVVGYTPYFIHLDDGDYNLSLSKNGYTLYNERITIPSTKDVYLEKINLPEGNDDEFDMDRSEKIQAYFMVTLFIALAAMGILFPTLLL